MPKPRHPADCDDSLATRASLLGRLKNWDDSRSWQEFSETYSRLIRAVAIKAGLTEAEAKDVEQETLLSVAKTIHEFESNPERGSFKSWLLNLTRWRVADQFRRRGPAGAMHSFAGDGTNTRTPTIERVPGQENFDDAWETEWKRNILEVAMERISRDVKPKHLQIFDLYTRRHMPASDVARELGVTRVQVYIVHHRLTKLLKQEVEQLSKALE